MMNLCKFDWKKCLHIFFFENCIILFVEVYNHDKQQYICMIQKIHHWNLNTFFLNWKKVIHPKLKIHPQFFFKFFDNLVWHFHQKWYYLLFNSGVLNYYTTSFLGFSLYVSNTTERLEGTLCFKDKNFKASNIPSVFNIICPVHGQYVIYYNERLQEVTYPEGYSKHAHNNLCEVEVFGE